MSAGPRKKRLPFVPHDPPPEYVPGIGEIVMRWSRLEYQLGVVVRELVNTSKQRQQAALLSKKAPDLCALLLLIAPKFTPSDVAAAGICDLARKVRSAVAWRDNYVHSVYGHWSDAPGVPIRFRLQSNDKGIQGSQISTAEFQTFAEKVKAMEDQAQHWTDVLKQGRGDRRKPR